MESNAVKTEQDAEALVLGLGLFATGGGGLASRGLGLLRSLLEAGLEVAWVAPENIDDDTLTCSVFGMGSIAPHPPMTPEEMLAFGVDGVRHPRPWLRALSRLERYLGERVGAVVPLELGPNNTIAAVDVAVRTGRRLVDGDYIGRALPKMSQALPAVLSLHAWPLAICDPWGNSVLLEDCPSASAAERMGKMVSKVTKAVDMAAPCCHAGFAHRMADVGSALVPGTLSRSLELGRAVLATRAAGKDPVLAAVEAGKGCVLYRGIVTERRWDDSPDGYMEGRTLLLGSGEDEGVEAEIWFQNEHHVLWRGANVAATSPDVITVVDAESAEPISNSELEEGRRVAVVGFRAAPVYRSGAPLEATAPAHYGFTDIAWTPIEQLNPHGYWDR